MSDPNKVVCRAHGETPATFVCRHVTRGAACGFHAGEPTPESRWPDAWCDGCEEVFQAGGGEWTEALEQQADIQLLCTHCYEAARARNLRVPPLARGSQARLTDREGSALIQQAVQTGRALQDASDLLWRWRGAARWDFDDQARTLAFQDPGRPRSIADVQLVGSFSTRSGTFQWAWQTLAAGDPAAVEVSQLRAYGEVRGLEQLTTPSLACDEVHGWKMTALAGYLLDAEGMYSAPFDHLRWFMLLRGWRAAP